MLIGIWNYHEILHRDNFMLSPNTNSVLGEDVLKSFYEFTKDADLSEHEFKILDDRLNFKTYDKFIFFNYPKLDKKIVKDAINSSKPKYLFNLECPTIYPQTWNKDIYHKFDKIFTWHDDLIDNKKFFKINTPSYSKDRTLNLPNNKKEKLCVIIGSNKKNDHINDLYHKRLDIIKWYEKNALNDLDFFGYGWSNYLFTGNRIIRSLNKINILTKLLSKKYKNYRGVYNGNKVNLLRNYKFSYCIENAKGYRGYITEKIFHCFFSMTVPIYLGCPNISEHVPKSCYIDIRDFKNLDDIHSYIKNMTDIKYNKYLSSIKEFLKSEKYKYFSNEYYIKSLKKNIFNI